MLIRILCCLLAVFPFASLHAQSQPLVDYHQHLFSPAIVKLSPKLSLSCCRSRALLERCWDSAGSGVIGCLSVWQPNKRKIEDEYAQVRAENDWTGEQVSRFPGRLRAFCG